MCAVLHAEHSSLLFCSCLSFFKEKGGQVSELRGSEEKAADMDFMISGSVKLGWRSFVFAV